jgi:N-acetylglucosaminyldiphosphoundecaprenol N-acetyl-beta-D-mannosaminyltransferase
MSITTEKINIRGVFFDNVTMDEAAEKAAELINSGGLDYIFTPNSEIVQACIDNPALYDTVNSASLIIPDGIGVVYASKILKRPLKEKVAGFDLSKRVLAYAAENGKKVYFFGSAPAKDGIDAVCDIAAEKIKTLYPGIDICGTRHGFFTDADTDSIIADINDSEADILFVCLGAPKQEKWIFDNREKLKVSLAMGLGGSLDVYAGTVKRAPDIFIKLNLEWFYRLMKQPKRIGRMMNLPKFLFGTIFYKLSGKDKKNNN